MCIGVNCNYVSLMIERQALEARKMLAQGNALGKRGQKGERCRCERPFSFISKLMFDKDVSHLQRSTSRNALYPALCAGLTSYALSELIPVI